MPPAVLPEHGPTLPELLGRRWPRRRSVVAVIAAAVLLVAAWVALAGPSDERHVVHRSPVAFNFRHDPALEPVMARPGETLRLERRRGRNLHHAFAISPLELPPYRGNVGGALPAFASREAQRMSADYDAFRLLEEGKTRINGIVGYEMLFQGERDRQTLYGRLVLLPEPEEGSRRGVRILLESSERALPRPQAVGIRGINKLPYRSFRFGTEQP